MNREPFDLPTMLDEHDIRPIFSLLLASIYLPALFLALLRSFLFLSFLSIIFLCEAEPNIFVFLALEEFVAAPLIFLFLF